VDDKIAVLYETRRRQSPRSQAPRSTTGALFVDNYTEFRVKFRVRQFGSFGAVRMPSVSVTAALRLNDTLTALVKRAEELNAAYAQLRNFTEAVSLFADTVYGQLQNLTQLIQILNLTGTALRTGGRRLKHVHVRPRGLEDADPRPRRRRKWRGGGSKPKPPPCDYQYTALITAANLLEVQSSALYSYKAAAAEALKSLTTQRRNSTQ
jgi:hypothetical protein